MTEHYFIGVDGGGTGTRVRIEDAAGNLLGQSQGGPANIRLSVTQAWQSIHRAIEKACLAADISPFNQQVLHVGMGLAGCEMQEAYQAFINSPHSFTTLVLASDAYTACLGAHGGEDGAIIIAGTGVVGFQIQSDQTQKISGHGFPHDDEGGGAWLGLEAVKHTLQCWDGRLPISGLANLLQAHFSNDLVQLVDWANQANSTAFATLAPLVIQAAQSGDADAIALLQQAAQSLDRIDYALQTAQLPNTPLLPCSLVGGIAPFLQPYLGDHLRTRLRPCLQAPDAGAILLVRHYLKTHQPRDTHDGQ